MTIVTSAFSWNYGQPWCSSASATTEPWYKINAQLVNWIAGIGDSSKISMAVNPGQNTTLNSSTEVSWMLRFPEADTPGNALCADFIRRAGDYVTFSPNYINLYPGWASGSANNGRGSTTGIINSLNPLALKLPTTVLNNAFISTYEADVPLPWFALTSHQNGTNVQTYIIARLDISTDSIPTPSNYPSTGIAPWLLMYVSSSTHQISTVHNIGPAVLPPKGTSHASAISIFSCGLIEPKIAGGYLFRTRPLTGAIGPIGAIKDDLLLTSYANSSYLESVVIDAKTYTRIGDYILMRTA